MYGVNKESDLLLLLAVSTIVNWYLKRIDGSVLVVVLYSSLSNLS